MAVEPGLRLVRRVAQQQPVVLDDSQWAVIDSCLAGGPTVVLGAPGTGKTTTLVESVVARVEHGTPASGVLMFAADRRAAAGLRDRVTARLGQTVMEPAARTPAAYAFSLIRGAARAAGDPEPRLISGPEQDAILKDILAGHARGEGRDPQWPSFLREALELNGFRHELRDLLMRAMERGLTPADLAELGRRADRPAWVSASVLMQEYLEVTALAAAGAYDPAAIVDAAVYLLESDPELLEHERRRWDLVVVDDLHEVGEAVARLVECLRPPGSDVLLAGDPDATTQSFRGADPGLPALAPERFPQREGDPAPVVALECRWRTPAELMGVIGAVTSSIGVVGSGAQRQARTVREGGQLLVGVVGSAAQEAAWVSRVLREQHLTRGVAWSDMAVIVRASGQAATLRRALSAAQVPTATGDPAIPLKDEPAVRPLRQVLRAAVQPSSLTPQVALELLSGPLGEADALDVRRIRRWLATRWSSAQEPHSSVELLSQVLRERDPQMLQDAPAAVRARLDPLVAVLDAGARAAAGAAGDAEQVLWAVWQASGLAERLRRQALSPDGNRRRAQQADRDLDAVMALFETAQRFAERNPGAGPLAFLDVIEAQEVPEDTLAAKAPQGSCVSVLTPQSAAGKEWDVVVLAGLTEGVWPDTRLRGSLLGSSALVDLLTGREEPSVRAARAQVLADERRMFHVAVTRSRRLPAAVAISTEEEQPSEFFGVLHRHGGEVTQGAEIQRTPLGRPITLAGVVAELRRTLQESPPESDQYASAAAELARLVKAGVSGADPEGWYGLAGPSDATPLWAPDAAVPVSPSSLETYLACPLRWLLQKHGGQGPATTRQAVGNLVHDVAHEYPTGTAAELEQARVERFDQLGLPATWVGHREDERSAAMVGKLAGYLAATDRELVATELDFSVRIGRAVLRGRVDRLERDAQGRLVVVDLKTGSHQPTKDALGEHPQLGAYQAAVEAGAFRELTGSVVSGGAVLLQLGGKQRTAPAQVQRPVGEADDPTWADRMVTQAADGMAGTTFAAIRNDGCRHCSVRACCPLQPEGRQIG